LLVAAGEGDRGLRRSRRLDAEPREPPRRRRAPPPQVEPSPARVRRERRVGQVVLDRAAEREPFALAVLAQEPQPLADPAPGGGARAGDALDPDHARADGFESEERAEQLGAAGAD